MEKLQRSPKAQDIIEDKNVQWKRTEEKEPEYSVILQSPITVWLECKQKPKEGIYWVS
jgi:hypothetical protein